MSGPRLMSTGFQRLEENGGFDSEANVATWSAKDVGDWLGKLGLGEHAKSFEQHRITGDMLHSLNENHLKELNMSMIGARADARASPSSTARCRARVGRQLGA